MMQRGRDHSDTLIRTSCFLALLLFTFQTCALENQLKNHPSPYLSLHGDNPVAWQIWGPQVVRLAQQQDKLIFISSGYFSCHWCHVMHRETYSNPAIAKLLNELAIPVKIDRELQPALDAWLIDFTEKTLGYAGWPLNVFLTPQGYPLLGMTYLPPEDFAETLRLLNDRWHNDHDELVQSAKAAFELISPDMQSHTGKIPDTQTADKLLQRVVSQALVFADEMGGGFGEQNKFPMSPQLIALLRIQAISPNPRLERFLRLTLLRMATLGLRDHVGGGFFRYVVDPDWDTPHFEKMLYDNAQLTSVYLLAAQVLDSPAYTTIATDTLDFLLEVMQQPDGAMISSLSAVDDRDIEGGYYLWQNDELKQLLTETQYQIATRVWGITGTPHLQGGYHLKYVSDIGTVAKELNLTLDEASQQVANIIERLQAARSQRAIPKDDKTLAAWNGLALSSLSQAVIQTGNKRYQQAAQKLYQFLSTKIWDGTHLHRFIKNDRAGGQVSLEDYAYVAQGMLAWSTASGDLSAFKLAKTIALAGLQRFHNEHGWQLSESLPIPYQARELVITDHSMTSPSSTLLQTLLLIARSDKDNALENRILKLLDSDRLDEAAFWYASHILLMHSALQTAQE